MTEQRKPVTHTHPCVAAAIHVLRDAGGGPLPAKVIFDRAFDRGLLAATAYNTLRARLSQHQKVETVVVVKTSGGYMLSLEGVPEDVPDQACAPNRPPLRGALAIDPLAIVPSPRPARRRRKATKARELAITRDWLRERQAPVEVVRWWSLARWQSDWRGEPDHVTARDILMGWLPPAVASWFIAALPLDRDLRSRLAAAVGQNQRRRILLAEENAETPSRGRGRPADTSGGAAPSPETTRTAAATGASR